MKRKFIIVLIVGEPLPYNFDYDYPIKNKCCLECQQVLNWGGFDEK